MRPGMKEMNAIYKAMKDMEWFSSFRFPKVSDLLGPVKMCCHGDQTENKAHNVVPSQCSFVADMRVNELYSFEEIISEIKKHVKAEVKPRSLRMRSSMIPVIHELVQSGIKVGTHILWLPHHFRQGTDAVSGTQDRPG